MNPTHTRSQRTPRILAAKQAAMDAGVPFSDSYWEPYQVKTVSTVGKDPYFDFDHAVDPFRRDKDGCTTHYEEDHAAYCAGVTELHCVEFGGRNRFGGFHKTYDGAFEAAQGLNERHYRVAAMSENPKHPVLL